MIKKILLGLLLLLIILALGAFAYYKLVIYQPPAISAEDRANIDLMPLPAKLELNGDFADLSKGLKVNYLKFKSKNIARAVDRYVERLENKLGRRSINSDGVMLNICCLADAQNQAQQEKEDESYTLEIETDEILLEANSPYGIYRGLETLFQLVSQNEEGDFVIPTADVVDTPRFPWRGIMLDVCRHWIPKDVVLRTIDAMSAVKMNVFHWHLSEDQGFRVESKVFPKLHEIGSNGKYYTQEEIKEVIQYAAERGIRVVPEFDLPGHSKSWQMAYPELSSVDFPLEFGRTNGELFAPPLDPTKENVYAFLDQFVGEMAALFPDPYLHIGGDEVNPEYWNNSTSIQTFMSEKGMRDHRDLQVYFNHRMYAILKKHGKHMLGWEEILHPDLGNDIIIQSWKSQKSLFEGVQRGGTGILSAGYYLDHKLHAGKYYEVDPLVLPGAVDIIPDSLHWKMYDLTLEIPAGDMEAQLVFFDKDPENIYGFFAIMDARNAFKQGVLGNDGILSFEMSTQMGELGFEAEIYPESLDGKLSFGILSFSAYGPKTGGVDMPGTEMPKIEVVRPLTEDEKSRIIGGEACMWSEVVGPENVDSRIWPTTAAIAEKLWSPGELTNNSEDMYRRLASLSDKLIELGATYEQNYDLLLRELGGDDGYEPLKILVDILEEMKYYGRLSALMEMEAVYLPEYPLDRIVDAAKPESMQARAFNQLVESYIDDPSRADLLNQIRDQLEIWSKNHEWLQPFMERSEKIKEVENISKILAELSDLAINKLNGENLEFSEGQLMEKLNFLETGEHGVMIAVVPGLKKVIIE